MIRLNKNGKQRLVKALAGITAVCISPLLVTVINENTPRLTGFMANAAQYVEENVNLPNIPEPLIMNESALFLYKPADFDSLYNTGNFDKKHTSEVQQNNTLLNSAGYMPDKEFNSGIITERLPPLDFIEVENFSENENDKTVNSITQSNEKEEFLQQEAASVMSQNISGTREDLSEFNSTDGHIVNTTFTSNPGTAYINLEKAGQVRNETKLDNEVVLSESMLLPEFKLELNGEPEVLIMHTHTSEAYQLNMEEYFDSSYTSRTLDSEKNVVAVGAEISRSLAMSGITVIHDGTVHDNPEYSGAYERSAQTVKNILAKYPSVKVVLDIHRDAIEQDGARVAVVTEIDGKNAAQVMIISAADDGTYDIPNYMKNFRLASLLQQQMEQDYEGITRPVLFQYCHYNQQLTTGSLLIEIGSHGNSLEQAKYTGELIGKSIAKALISIDN